MKIAVVGATGAVGTELLSILKSRKFPVTKLIPLASSRSQGKLITYEGRQYPCQVISKEAFADADLAFFDVSDELSKEWVPIAAETGCWVVDSSSVFRLSDQHPLVVPEVNGDMLRSQLQKIKNAGGVTTPTQRILSGPNCSTVQLVLVLKVIDRLFKLKRVVVSTYQSTSGAGQAAVDELKTQTMDLIAGKPIAPEIFPHQIAFNCIPQIGSFKSDAYTSEEQKVIAESRKILQLPDLRITVTAVRVPAVRGHGESVNIECVNPIDLNILRKELALAEGIQVCDEPGRGIYPLNESTRPEIVEPAHGTDPVFVGRMRRDDTVENGVNLWIVSDNLRKGAALNAVQIAEILVHEGILE